MPPNAERRPLEDAAQTVAPQWYAILHPPRRLWVLCSGCGYSAFNELNTLRRWGWTDSADSPRRYRCGDCDEAAL
jgi:hypothetical protein